MADSDKVPYLQSYGNITKALERIQHAAIPDKFTQDFLSTKLDMSGGSARPVIKYLKRAGFLATDGTPTDVYRRFKNQSEAGAAAADALRKAYASLYEVNEYAHELKDEKLKGVILQVTGLESDAKLVPAMIGSFKALKSFADFDMTPSADTAAPDGAGNGSTGGGGDDLAGTRVQLPQSEIRLGYTINLNLPATTDIAVFNAIFKSLREHLLS